MSWFCVGTGNTYSSKKAQFLVHPTQDQIMTPIPQNGVSRASKISN